MSYLIIRYVIVWAHDRESLLFLTSLLASTWMVCSDARQPNRWKMKMRSGRHIFDTFQFDNDNFSYKSWELWAIFSWLHFRASDKQGISISKFSFFLLFESNPIKIRITVTSCPSQYFQRKKKTFSLSTNERYSLPHTVRFEDLRREISTTVFSLNR